MQFAFEQVARGQQKVDEEPDQQRALPMNASALDDPFQTKFEKSTGGSTTCTAVTPLGVVGRSVDSVAVFCSS